MTKTLKLLAGIFILIAQLGLSAQTNETLSFANGDVLNGALQGIDAGNIVRWQAPDAREPIAFNSTNITRITFPPRATPPLASPNACRVRLVNDDILEGTFVSCNGEAIQMDARHAGPLTIPRKSVRSITMLPPAQSAIYQGPTGLDGWTQGRSAIAGMGDAGQWSYRNGAFYAGKSASIARDLKLPNVAQLEFDLRWQGRFQLALALYSDSLQPVSLAAKENEPDFGGFYSFQVNNDFADLIAISKREPLRYLEPVVTPMLSRTNRAHLDLRINKQHNTVALLIDGALVKEWNDTNGFVGQGTGVRFVHQGFGSVKLSNIRLSSWNGILDVRPSLATDNTHDVLRLTDNSQVQGSIQSISNGQLSISLPQSSTSLPLSRVSRIEFAHREDQTKGSPGEIRTFFGQSACLTLRIDAWDSVAVIGTHPLLGKIKLSPSVITRLQFVKSGDR